MKRYFESISKNENIISGSDLHDSTKSGFECVFVYTFCNFGVEELTKYENSRGIPCIDLYDKLDLSIKRVFSQLPNEYIDDHQLMEKAVAACCTSIINESDSMVILFVSLTIESSRKLLVNGLSFLIKELSSRAKSHKHYYLNFDIESMLLYIIRKSSSIILNVKTLFTTIPICYGKTEQSTNSIVVNRAVLESSLLHSFKKYFESEMDLTNVVSNLFNKFESMDKVFYIQSQLLINDKKNKMICINITKGDFDDNMNNVFTEHNI